MTVGDDVIVRAVFVALDLGLLALDFLPPNISFKENFFPFEDWDRDPEIPVALLLVLPVADFPAFLDAPFPKPLPLLFPAPSFPLPWPFPFPPPLPPEFPPP